VLGVDAREQEPAPQPRLVVAQAMVKQDAAEQALTTLTEVGADEVVAWRASRSVVTWEGERVGRGLRRWQAAALQAAKQSRRSWVPVVTGPVDQDGLLALVRAATLAVLLDAPDAVPLGEVPVPEAGEVLVVVGPEGGLTDEDRSDLQAAGARTASLGPTVLRSATAGTVAAGVLLSRSPRWRVRASAGGGG
jgi:16S rRNA (uracil1498-N3)-methyltransferase